jgi:hypothetical protein
LFRQARLHTETVGTPLSNSSGAHRSGVKGSGVNGNGVNGNGNDQGGYSMTDDGFTLGPNGYSGPGEPAIIRRFRDSSGAGSGTNGHADHLALTSDSADSPAVSARDFDDLIDRIVTKLERRVLDDLQLRGRRHMPEVF